MASQGSRIIDLIRPAILRGEWKPGERLQPNVLAERFGTSTTVIREALNRLSGDELVVAIPNRGFFIRTLDLRELEDLTELRCTVEALGVQMSIARGELAWESELLAIHHQLQRTPRRPKEDPTHINEDWQVAHKAFHAKLLEASECSPILKLSENLADSTELYRRWSSSSRSASQRNVEAEHEEILNAVLARDAEKAGQLLRQHYELTKKVIVESGLVAGIATTY